MKIGVDIVKVSRLKEILKRKKLDSVFSKAEQERIFRNKNTLESASSYFASKEAFSKAMGIGIWKMGLDSVEVLHDDMGKPYFNILNKEKIPFSNEEVDLSIAHDGEYCIAAAVLKDPLQADRKISGLLKKRKRDSNKGDYGRAALIGGSSGMSGSCFLSSTAALRSGAGLSYTIVPDSISQILQIKSLETIVIPICTEGGDFNAASSTEVLEKIKNMDAIGIGPGLGSGEEIADFVKKILIHSDKPFVVDADALNALSKDLSYVSDLSQDIILTPHPLEMARLLGTTVEEVEKDRISAAKHFANVYGCTLLLKGSKTVVTNGEEVYINTTGNPGMATAGSGDVLTGIILALLGQGYGTMEAGKMGAYIHGSAGDLAKEELGEMGMVASDIIRYLPKTLKRMEES